MTPIEHLAALAKLGCADIGRHVMALRHQYDADRKRIEELEALIDRAIDVTSNHIEELEALIDRAIDATSNHPAMQDGLLVKDMRKAREVK